MQLAKAKAKSIALSSRRPWTGHGKRNTRSHSLTLRALLEIWRSFLQADECVSGARSIARSARIKINRSASDRGARDACDSPLKDRQTAAAEICTRPTSSWKRPPPGRSKISLPCSLAISPAFSLFSSLPAALFSSLGQIEAMLFRSAKLRQSFSAALLSSLRTNPPPSSKRANARRPRPKVRKSFCRLARTSRRLPPRLARGRTNGATENTSQWNSHLPQGEREGGRRYI